MPDYNRKATVYRWTMVLIGLAAIVHSAVDVAMLPPWALAQVLAGMGIAMVAGFFPVRIGRSKSSFVAGEVFIFLLLLMHGPAAATLAAGCETMVGSLRSSKRWTSRIASPTLSALAMFCCGTLLHALLESLSGMMARVASAHRATRCSLWHVDADAASTALGPAAS